MLTRADSQIMICEAEVGKPLPYVQAWANSSHVMLITLDCVAASVSVKIGDPLVGKYRASVEGVLHPVRRFWRFYIPPSAFHAGETRYKVVATDLEGNRHVLGEGMLRVFKGVYADPVDSDGGEEAKDNAYLQHNGTWYAVRVVEDESGTPSFELAGVVQPPAGASGEPYAYNNHTGLFHRVTIEEDGGLLCIALNSIGTEDVSGSFAKGVDGFYHRIECAPDGSGAIALEVGEGQ